MEIINMGGQISYADFGQFSVGVYRGSTKRNNESIPSKTHFQKEMFLLLKETIFSKIEGYGFVPHYYGPFSRDLDSDLVELTVSDKVDDTDGYTLTPIGFRETSELWNKLDPTHKSALIRINVFYGNFVFIGKRFKVIIQVLKDPRGLYSVFLEFSINVIY